MLFRARGGGQKCGKPVVMLYYLSTPLLEFKFWMYRITLYHTPYPLPKRDRMKDKTLYFILKQIIQAYKTHVKGKKKSNNEIDPKN